MLNNRLKIYFGNSKLHSSIAHLSLPSGYSCPGACDCLSRAHRQTGHITDGKDIKFRCYSASQEAVYSSLRKSRWSNFDLLRQCKTKREYFQLIDNSISPISYSIKIFRIHVGGDFFNQNYFDAWLKIARKYSKITFYAYTKSLPFWVKRLKTIPKNLILTASRGGKFDYLINKYKLKESIVLFEKKSYNSKIPVDKDDSLAYTRRIRKFGLLLHGTQPAKTFAGKCWSIIKKTVGGYSKFRTP